MCSPVVNYTGEGSVAPAAGDANPIVGICGSKVMKENQGFW